MFKFNIPMSIIVSSGSLMLLAIGSLLLICNSAHTIGISVPEDKATTDGSDLDKFATAKNDDAADTRNASVDTRRRNGRIYSQTGYGAQQQGLESFAAAYAADNSPSSVDQSSNLAQSTVQANDASAYASFGELPPNSASNSPGSATRQLSTADYMPSSSYYANFMSPSSNSASYSGQQSSGSGYHSTSNHYPHYQKLSITPPAYPTNSYDRYATGYHDRAYPSMASSPIWSASSSGGLMSTASSALSHWTGGFGISEIICGLIALSIGAVILGAPFFLIYLALMGNFSGSGTLSLTNPNAPAAGGSAPPANGRRKRLAIFEQIGSNRKSDQLSNFVALANSAVSRLSPLIDTDKMVGTFRQLIDSIEKYSKMEPEKDRFRGKA